MGEFVCTVFMNSANKILSELLNFIGKAHTKIVRRVTWAVYNLSLSPDEVHHSHAPEILLNVTTRLFKFCKHNKKLIRCKYIEMVRGYYDEFTSIFNKNSGCLWNYQVMEHLQN